MQRIPARAGDALVAIETPALVVDLAPFERNLERMADATKGIRLRPHAKSHKCATIARAQIARGAVGICCQKTDEAAAFVEAGIRDVLVTNEVVAPAKVERLATLATHATIGVLVDSAAAVDTLSGAAMRASVTLDVYIEVDVGAHRCGVVPGAVADRWEGAARPGHFAGVLTIVAKLFHLVEPDVACFGQKDIQQATVVRAMVRDLDWRLEIEVVPTVREPDGLALSSRNVYLSPDERRDALGLSDALRAVETAFRAGERSAGALERVARTRLELYAGVRDEYIAIVEPAGLAPVDRAEAGTIVAIAARVGATRLIDNVILRED